MSDTADSGTGSDESVEGDGSVDGATLETKYAFTGDTGWIIVAILCCPPFGVYYYLDNREEVAVCPACRDTVDPDASTCPHCTEDLDQYR